MHIKKFLVVPIISSLLMTGCIKLNEGESTQEKEQTKKEEVVVEESNEDLKEARKAIMDSDYKKAESILVLALAENEEDESINILYRQVKLLIEIQEKIKDKKYDEANVRCTILLLDEKIDTVVEYEVERLQGELDKLDIKKPNDSKKNRNIKVDKKKDITPKKAMDIVREYIKKTHKVSKPQVSIVDMYSIDGQSYYYIYAYRIKTSDGIAKEEGIAYYDVNMRTGKLIEYLIHNPNYKATISKEKAISISQNYMAKQTNYKPESFKVVDVLSEGRDTFYCIEAYGRDGDNNLIMVGYFEVHVETGAIRADIYPPEIQPEEPSEVVPPVEDNTDIEKPKEPEIEQPETPKEPEVEQPVENVPEADTNQEQQNVNEIQNQN